MADPQQTPPTLEQFLQLLPMTAVIAGLPQGEQGKYYNDDQMDLRAQALKRAFKHSQKLAKEMAGNG